MLRLDCMSMLKSKKVRDFLSFKCSWIQQLALKYLNEDGKVWRVHGDSQTTLSEEYQTPRTTSATMHEDSQTNTSASAYKDSHTSTTTTAHNSQPSTTAMTHKDSQMNLAGKSSSLWNNFSNGTQGQPYDFVRKIISFEKWHSQNKNKNQTMEKSVVLNPVEHSAASLHKNIIGRL